MIQVLNTFSKIQLVCFFLFLSLSLSSQFTTTTKSTTTRKNDCVQLSPFCSCLGGPLYIYCYNFTSFSQIDFTLLGEIRNISILSFYPNKPVILNNSLNLEGINLIDSVVFNNVAGIDLKQNPFLKWTPKDNLSLSFFSSNFSESMECNSNLIDSSFRPIFSSFKTIMFGYRNSYPVQLCPLLFYNASLTYLNVSEAVDTDHPKFSDIVELETINSNIDVLLIFSGQRMVITSGLMNRLVFENVNTVRMLNTVLQRIDEDAFSKIYNMRFLNFSIVNFQNFFKNSTNKWMQNLNSKVKVDYSNPESLIENENKSLLVNLNSLHSSFFFYFTDEDYDNFKYFPHENFVFARIVMLYPLNCSKTMKFLLQNARYYPLDFSNVNSTATADCITQISTSSTDTQSSSTTKANSSMKFFPNFYFNYFFIFLALFSIK